MLHPDLTTYPCGSDERGILDTFRAAVQAALSRNGCSLRVDGLSVTTIRAIMRDREFIPGVTPDPEFTALAAAGLKPIYTAFLAAETAYDAARNELMVRPAAKPRHT